MSVEYITSVNGDSYSVEGFIDGKQESDLSLTIMMPSSGWDWYLSHILISDEYIGRGYSKELWRRMFKLVEKDQSDFDISRSIFHTDSANTSGGYWNKIGLHSRRNERNCCTSANSGNYLHVKTQHLKNIMT